MQANTLGVPQQPGNRPGIDTFINDISQASNEPDIEIADASGSAIQADRHTMGIGLNQSPEYGTDSVDDDDFDIRKASPRTQARWMAPNGLLRH